MPDVTSSQEQDQESVELSASDEQLLRELTEQARNGGLRLDSETHTRPAYAPWAASFGWRRSPVEADAPHRAASSGVAAAY